MQLPLPMDERIEEIVELVRARRAVVIVAPPGSGKTTRVPPALVADGPVVLLQPRRVAARSLARRIAAERRWTVGEEVGWQVRFERRFGKRTRLLVATEGVLTARLQSDPLLTGFRTVVLDEFHERSLHGDLALALVRQAAAAREDLRVVVMSATLDAEPVSEFLDGCPVVRVRGRLHPVEIEYAPESAPSAAIHRILERGNGHVLCFLPGAPEIRRVAAELRDGLPPGVDVRPLHGSLDAEAQDAALAPSSRRKLILATNLAETSLTVEGVEQVVDSGLHKVLRREPALGIDRLEVQRISRDSAEQRAGRAGRTGPGIALRLWDPRARLRAHREPEIGRVDLANPFLEVLAWGGDPLRFEWFEPPPEEAARSAMRLLDLLGAVERGRITALGRALRRLPLHPRLGRLLLACGGSAAGAAACAALSEGWSGSGDAETTTSDLLLLADRLVSAPARVRRAAKELRALAARIGDPNRGGTPRVDERPGDEILRRAVLAAYPDRVARRREPASPRLVLASGHGAVLARESGVRDGEFLVAVELVAGTRGPGSEALVRMASRIEPSWILPTHRETCHEVDPASGVVRAFEQIRHHELILSRRHVAPDPATAAGLVADLMLERGLGERAEVLVRRLRFAGIETDIRALIGQACHGRTEPFEVDLGALLPHDVLRSLDRLAPEAIRAPSGRRLRLDYRDDGSVHASVKLQELFGLSDTPRIGARGEPVTFSLLAPNGRPVQTTRDLRSFWDTAYGEVRKQLRGRYPKHPWPEDPWSAEPTARTKGKR